MIVGIPSAALLITCGTATGYLISEGLSAHDYSSFLQQTVGPTVQIQSVVEQERTISLRALGGDQQALAGLSAQWDATNKLFANASKVDSVGQGINPGALTSSVASFRQLAAQLPSVRQDVLTRRASATEVDSFYTQLVNVGSSAFLQSALSASDSQAAVDTVTVLDLFPVVDLHSRAMGLGAGWAEGGAVLSPADRLVVAQLAGAYRNQLQALVPRLTGSEQAAYSRLVAGSAWKVATSGEDDLVKHGELGQSVAGWLAAENTVSGGLLGLYGDSFRQAENAAEASANQTLSRSTVLGGLALALAVGALVTAVVLANGLVRRLRRLREKTLELAGEMLPSVVARIGDGELVDIGSELALSGYGGDEIGQVAEAFNAAQRTAVAAAVAEARTRSGISKVFLDIAHRSQLVVHRQLEVLDVAEARQGDPEHLEFLFQLDHLATRARRNAENLLILGGGQPGRRWRKPAGLEDIVRSAVSETEHFARVAAVRLPAVLVQGAVVGDLIHLLAELVDNATAFSPPDAAVSVRGNLVGKGVVVEVEDQGLGIDFAERERLNQALADPPDFQSMALSGQRHLGLFVVGQLARRHGIAVSLLESAYGGVKAIVLVPAGVVEAGEAAGGGPPAPARPGRHEQPQDISADEAAGPVPLQRIRNGADLRGRAAPPAPRAGLVAPYSPRPDSQAGVVSPAPRETASGPAQERSGRSRAALPRRERLANLAPGLRLNAEETPQAAAPRRPPRSPEEARGSMSAFQRGTRMGRDAPGQDNR